MPFPTSLDTITDGVTTIQAAHVKSLQNMLVGPAWLNVKGADYGAKGDGQFVRDGAITSGLAVLTSASGRFVAGDVGKLILVQFAGASSAQLLTTIASFQSSTQVTLTANAGTTATNAFVLWGSDDTASFTSWLAACQVIPGARGVIPPGIYCINGALPNITAPVDITGSGCSEQFGSLVSFPNSVNIPGQSPYLSGCVIWQFATATDILKVTGTGITINLRDFGLAFAGMYANTGHGINISPPADGANLDMGIAGSQWNGVKVYGHDGNHYGFRVVNTFYNTFTHCRSYGGGGLFLRGDTTRTAYGNDTFDHLYVVQFLNGTAHAVRLEGSSNGRMNLVSFIRLQSWVYNPDTAIPGTTSPANTVKIYSNDGNATCIDLFGPDLEANQGSTSTLGTGQGLRLVGGWGGNIDGYAVTGGAFSPNLETESALILEGRSSTQSNDVMIVHPYAGAALHNFGIKGHNFGDGTYYWRSQETVAFAASYTPDCTNTVTKLIGALTANITINQPSFATAGMHLNFIFKQDGTGGRTITWNAIFKTVWQPAPAANAISSIRFEYDGTNWQQLSGQIPVSELGNAAVQGSFTTSKDRRISRQTPAHAASPAPDATLGEIFNPGAMTGNVTVANPTNSAIGQRLMLIWTQDGTGGRTVTYSGTNWRSVGIAAQSTTLSTVTIDEAHCIDGTIWRVNRLVTGQTI